MSPSRLAVVRAPPGVVEVLAIADGAPPPGGSGSAAALRVALVTPAFTHTKMVITG